jgi:hypothetical protein
MKRRTLLMFTAIFAVILGLSVWLAGCSSTDSVAADPTPPPIKNTFVRLGNGVPGVLYEPVTPVEKSKIAIFVMHTAADYLENAAGKELANRGYTVLCANTSMTKSGYTADNDQDKMLTDAKLGVAYLKGLGKKVVLLGHSGGGGLMATYQNIAENGIAVCQGAEKIVKCPASLAGLPAADGVMLLDSNVGLPGVTLFSIDPAVTDETTGRNLDPTLDMYNPANGYTTTTPTHYTPEFIAKFSTKAGERMNALIAKALDRSAKIKAGTGNYTDDEPFIIPGAGFKGANNKLYTQDVNLWSRTRNKWPLLTKTGVKDPQIISTVRVQANRKSQTASLADGGLQTSVNKFLSTWAIRTTNDFIYDDDSLPGIDWKSSYANPVDGAMGIAKPLLVMGMTGGNEFFGAETIYENAKTIDKTLAFVEGATHGWTPCTECATAKGLPADYYGDTVKTLFDYVDGWLSKPGRF